MTRIAAATWLLAGLLASAAQAQGPATTAPPSPTTAPSPNTNAARQVADPELADQLTFGDDDHRVDAVPVPRPGVTEPLGDIGESSKVNRLGMLSIDATFD